MKQDLLACGMAAAAFFAVPRVSLAEEAQVSQSADGARAFKAILDNFSIRVGAESAGPLQFHDTADGTLEPTTVFQYGGRLAALFGSENKDAHRLGIGLSYNFVAKSASRDLQFIDPYVIYETGYPLVLQLHAGASFASGTKELADDHGGLYNAAALRYSFDGDKDSNFRVSPGIVAKSYLVTGDMANSSFFLGAQIEFSYNTSK